MESTRQPIVTVMGHIDHGKSSIVERLTHLSITKGEPGLITQCIKSYKVSSDAIKKASGDLLERSGIKLTIPGLLIIDSPVHAAFNNLRKRGGNLADIAILVIDLNQGMQDQTLECIEILKNYKTPFVVAANKIDLISGWNKIEKSLLENVKQQRQDVQQDLDKRIYQIVAKLSEFNVNSERFDRVDDFAKQVAIVPCSAQTGEGIAELIMVIGGLAQRYLKDNLKMNVEGEGKGIILEVQEEKGLGTSLDVILYDGKLKVNDQIVIGSLGEPIVSRVKGLFERENKKFKSVKEAGAACGIRVLPADIKDVIGGMPIRVANKNVDAVKDEIKREIEQVISDVDNEGIVVKADTLGSLEALIGLLTNAGLKIKRASIGGITKKDITEALAEKDQLNKVVAGFNVEDVGSKKVKIICSDVIYKITEGIEEWRDEERKRIEAKELEKVSRAFKVQILPGCVFRQSNPAVVGVKVLGGIMKSNFIIMKKDGSKAGYVKSMQKENENVEEAKKDDELAISIPDAIVGRQIKENDILYSDMEEENFVKLKNLKKYLKEDEIEVLKEIAKIKRRENPVWGI
ncbi:MAG: translation initiation factor IF-2 [Nanoarchaeota archaeon]